MRWDWVRMRYLYGIKYCLHIDSTVWSLVIHTYDMMKMSILGVCECLGEHKNHDGTRAWQCVSLLAMSLPFPVTTMGGEAAGCSSFKWDPCSSIVVCFASNAVAV
jgi:hypothetical protein